MDKQQFNCFEFKHIDDGTTINMRFQAMFCSEVIDNFVQFLRGCGHYETAIYEHMASVSKDYFELESKRNKTLLEKREASVDPRDLDLS